MKKYTIVVCGATGNQGFAVCKSLLKASLYRVVALSRNPGGKQAKQLQEAGAEVIKANTNDLASLLPVFKSADGVFGLTQPWSANYKRCDIAAELRQGENIIRACSNAGVRHLVFSSIINLQNQPTGVSHVDSKLKLEEMLRASGVSFTILRCAQFMDNIGAPFFPVTPGKVKGFIKAQAPVPYTACRDIGACAVQIFARPELFGNKTIDLIGDIVSGEQLAALIGQRQNRPVRYRAVPPLILRLFAPEFYSMRRWFEQIDTTTLTKARAAGDRYFTLTTMDRHLQANMIETLI